MRIFKTKPFARFAGKERIEDAALVAAVHCAEQGIVDADLGGGVIKQRIARRGAGKSGGFRAIVLLRHAHRAYFVYGFAKSSRSNIRADELAAFRKLATELLNLDDTAIGAALANGTITEVIDHG